MELTLGVGVPYLSKPFPCFGTSWKARSPRPGFFLAIRTSMPPKTDRNRRIMADFEAGKSLEQLSAEHGLTILRILAVLTDEKHRRRISPDPFYRSLRRV